MCHSKTGTWKSETKKKNIPDSFGLSALDSFTGIIEKTKIVYV